MADKKPCNPQGVGADQSLQGINDANKGEAVKVSITRVDGFYAMLPHERGNVKIKDKIAGYWSNFL